jgi:hypothetical protein
MSTELKYPEWQLPLQDAILDFRNKATLLERETAIRERLKSPGISANEREALIDALSLIRILREGQ